MTASVGSPHLLKLSSSRNTSLADHRLGHIYAEIIIIQKGSPTFSHLCIYSRRYGRKGAITVHSLAIVIHINMSIPSLKI